MAWHRGFREPSSWSSAPGAEAHIVHSLPAAPAPTSLAPRQHEGGLRRTRPRRGAAAGADGHPRDRGRRGSARHGFRAARRGALGRAPRGRRGLRGTPGPEAPGPPGRGGEPRRSIRSPRYPLYRPGGQGAGSAGGRLPQEEDLRAPRDRFPCETPPPLQRVSGPGKRRGPREPHPPRGAAWRPCLAG